MNIVEANIEHLQNVLVETGLGLSYLTSEQQFLSTKPGYAYAALNGDRVLAVCGIISGWHGVGDAYAFLTAEALRKYKFSLHRAVKWGLAEIVKKHNLHRVQMLVDINDKRAEAWAKALGFSFEGALPMYTSNKQTFLRYGKVWTQE